MLYLNDLFPEVNLTLNHLFIICAHSLACLHLKVWPDDCDKILANVDTMTLFCDGFNLLLL